MFNSLKAGRPFGIDLYVHGTFWLLPLFLLFGGLLSGGLSGAVFDVAVLLAVFGCVALHEVGHALAARFYGIHTRDITLYPIGGLAKLERMPERPWPEIVVALAGPAVNVVIAAGLALVLGVLGSPLVPTFGGEGLLTEFVGRVLLANGALVVFNPIPAFPMDGGRVLRAVLTFGMGRVRATEVAVSVGGMLAGILFLFALLKLQLMWLVLAAVVYLLGKAELVAVRRQEAIQYGSRRESGSSHMPLGWPGFAPRPEMDAFTGWRFDSRERVWTEWHAGKPIRRVARA